MRIPTDDLEVSFFGLNDCRAASDPIARVYIHHVLDLAHSGKMNISADHALGASPAGFLRQSVLKLTNEVPSPLDFILQIGRKRPIGLSETAACGSEVGVEPQRGDIAPISEKGQPFGIAHDEVELVSVHDQVALPIGPGMDRLALDRDAAELRAAIFAHGLVVIAPDVNEFGALPNLAQKLLQNIVMGLRPVDPAPDPPEVYDVANEVDSRRLVRFQKVQEGLGLASLGANTNVGNKVGAITLRPRVRLPLIFSSNVQHIKSANKLVLYQRFDTTHDLCTTKNSS